MYVPHVDIAIDWQQIFLKNSTTIQKINQTYENERNEQVAKMKTIYKHAEEVYIWLGPSYEDSLLAFQLMQDMYDHRDDVGRIARLFSQPDIGKAVFALNRLLGNDYWWRMWYVVRARCAVSSNRTSQEKGEGRNLKQRLLF